MSRNKLLQLLLALIVLVGVSWFLLHSIDLEVTANIISNVSLLPLFIAVPMVILSHVVRAIRWRRLLTHTKEQIGLGTSFIAVMIGYAANTIIPRSGELLRPLVVSRRSSLSYTALLSSVVLERVIDVISLLVALAILAVLRADVLQRALPSLTPGSIALSLGLPLALLAFGIWAIAFTHYGSVFANRFVRPFSTKAAAMVERIINEVKIGTATLRSGKGWLSIILETIAIWFLYALPIWLVLNALPWVITPYSFGDAWILLVIIAVGVTIAPTPGALGVYQAFAQIALVRLYGTTADQAMAFGILSWVLNYGSALIVGGICFMIDRATAPQTKSQEA